MAALTQVQDTSLNEVERAACAACCESFEPTPEDINPVVASLLYKITEGIVQRGGVTGCTVERGRQLQRFAEKCLPPVPAGDDDGFDTFSRYQQQSGRLSLERIYDLIPRPATQSELTVRNWAVGVTTAPRRQATLDVCLDSLFHAGWTEPVIFQDGEIAPSEKAANCPTCIRSPKTGAFPNFFLALVELYMRNADADAYMLIQDDAVFPREAPIREYLEAILWPGNEPCIVSLYTAAGSNGPCAGWHTLPARANVNGAVALLYPRNLLKQFITDRVVLEYRERSVDRKLAGFPDAVRDWKDTHGIPVFLPTPSLVQHIGQTSSIWSHGRAVGDRYADQFLGDLS
ncbi:MAG: hypothetical protein H8E66_32165 [Planctomycetes bacterium]|nr:hypothetical protein [Planctomycetota bacterium]